MSNLIVPTHIKQNEKTPPQATKTTKKSKKSTIADAYVKPEENLSLDPSKIGESVKERMPQPTGWRILILPYKGKAVTDGGIHLVQSQVDRESLATVVGYVVKMGPDCYKDSSKFTEAWCQEKQWVLIGRYAGARFKLGDESECRIINDDEVIATILDPDDILAV